MGVFMLLHLIENAESSLNIGLEFYRKYLSMTLDQDLIEVDGNLKFAIIGIHNSIELLIKQILTDVNELFIYEEETINDPEVLRYIGKKFQSDRKINLNSFMANYSDKFKTISFQKCIKRFKSLFDVNETDIETLERLNRYRNVLTHFGLEDITGEDKIIFTINKTLHIISNLLIPLINSKRENIEKELLVYIEDFIESNYFKFYDIWYAANEYVIDKYRNNIIEIVNNECDFEELFGFKVSPEIYDKSIIFWGEHASWIVERKDIPEKNISTLIDGNTKLLAILDYDEYDELYMYCPVSKMNHLDIMKLDSCKWRTNKNSQYYKIPLNSKTFINKVLVQDK